MVKTKEQHKKEYYSRVKTHERVYRRWQAWEIELILDKSLSDTEIARRLDRTIIAVQIKRSQLRKEKPISRKANGFLWTEEEEEMIRSGMKPSEIHVKTGRPLSTIYSKKQRMKGCKNSVLE